MNQRVPYSVDIEGAIARIFAIINEADGCASRLHEYKHSGGYDDFDDHVVLSRNIASAYEASLLLTETLELYDATKRISAAYAEAKEHEDGIAR